MGTTADAQQVRHCDYYFPARYDTPAIGCTPDGEHYSFLPLTPLIMKIIAPVVKTSAVSRHASGDSTCDPMPRTLDFLWRLFLRMCQATSSVAQIRAVGDSRPSLKVVLNALR